VPVPVRGRLRFGLEPSEVIAILPAADPDAVGVNVTVKVAFCPAARVRGALIPLIVNPVPLMAICEISTLDPPMLVTDSEIGSLFPTVTVPKSAAVGLSANCPGVMVVIPIPLRVMLAEESDALLVRVRVALKFPAALGVN